MWVSPVGSVIPVEGVLCGYSPKGVSIFGSSCDGMAWGEAYTLTRTIGVFRHICRWYRVQFQYRICMHMQSTSSPHTLINTSIPFSTRSHPSVT